jgi:pimeloyl-ACP methyl ester carboxylesterase
MDMTSAARSSITLTGGSELFYITAGDKRRPAVVLIHGFASASYTFRDIIPVLAEVAYVIAPDTPGHGRSGVLAHATFDGYAAAITELLDHLGVRERYIYLHDYGAPTGLRIAMDAPELVQGLIIQNANAHRSGFLPTWKETLDFYADPDPKKLAAATAHLTFEGVRDQYVSGVPEDVARRISPAVWEEDWRVMNLPGRMDTQRELFADYGHYIARFEAIARYLRKHQPPALMVWGRHDIFFALAETVSWMEDLPRMEAHILDGGHFLLETHAEPAAALMRDFVERTTKHVMPVPRRSSG